MLETLIALVSFVLSFFVGTMPASIVYAVFNESNMHSFDAETYYRSLGVMIAVIIFLGIFSMLSIASVSGLIIGIVAIGCLAKFDQVWQCLH